MTSHALVVAWLCFNSSVLRASLYQLIQLVAWTWCLLFVGRCCDSLTACRHWHCYFSSFTFVWFSVQFSFESAFYTAWLSYVTRAVATFEAAKVSATDLYKYSPDAVPPIHAISYHVVMDKVPTQNGDKFRSICSDNLQPIATRGKKARGTLLVDKHCGNSCSIKRAPLSVSYYNEISSGHIGRAVVQTSCSAGPVLPLWCLSRLFSRLLRFASVIILFQPVEFCIWVAIMLP